MYGCVLPTVLIWIFFWPQGNNKIWADLPQTCKYLPKTNCVKVQKVRKVKEKVKNCVKTPFQECKDVPKKKWTLVEKQNCVNEPYQDCQDVTREDCKDQHVQANNNYFSKLTFMF